MTRLLVALLMVAALASLVACGRAGPPRPPGPREQVIYPRPYPQYAPQPMPQAVPAPGRP